MKSLLSLVLQTSMVLNPTEITVTHTSLDACLPNLEENSRRVYLVRHGETQSCRVEGKLDGELTDNGRVQASEASALMKNIPVSLVASSALSRSEETADTIHSHFPRAVRVVSPRLREMNFGEFEGINLKESSDVSRFRAMTSVMKSDKTVQWPSGESIQDVEKRAEYAITQILDDFPAHDHLCIVGHSRLNRILLSSLCRVDDEALGKKQLPTCINVMDVDDQGKWTAHVINHCCDKLAWA